MDSQLQRIFRNSSSEKHFAPNTYSEIPEDKTELKITAGQNANWTYANFFIQNGDNQITNFKVNEGQYVILKVNGTWTLYDFQKNIKATDYNEIEKFVNLIVRAEKARNNMLAGGGVIADSEANMTVNKFSTALQTKPFLLLAGISGTGKSRIVRELAFMSCPEVLRDADGTTPGNYCMIEVKPNWHDSSELLGYWSNINEKYIFPKFVQFLIKAKLYPNVPFFVCLDEMNLAPVEQYFAEILSIIETRKHPKNNAGDISMDTVKTGAIIDKKYFRLAGEVPNATNIATGMSYSPAKTDRDLYLRISKQDTIDGVDTEVGNQTTLIDEGLTLPDNVFIIGTVNMDDTTHQFSRKVIDRAMTIEMNGGALEDMFGNDVQLSYRGPNEILPLSKVKPKYVTADEALKNCNTLRSNEEFSASVKGKDADGKKIVNSLPDKLNKINIVLKNTPFTVSYRVMNELVILLAVLCDEAEANGEIIDNDKFDSLTNTALDRILLMKILPRVEGDDEMFRISAKERKDYNLKESITEGNETVDYTKLDWLRDIAPQEHIVKQPEEQNSETPSDTSNSGASDIQNKNEYESYMAKDKLEEMTERLRRQNFTRYWP